MNIIFFLFIIILSLLTYGSDTFIHVLGKNVYNISFVFFGSSIGFLAIFFISKYITTAIDKINLSSSSEKNYLENIKRFLEQGNIDDAIYLCNKYLQSNPTDEHLIKLLISCYMQNNNIEMAKHFFKELMNTNNIDIVTLKEYEVYLEKNNIIDEHKEICKYIIRMDSFNYIYYFKIIDHCLNNNNIEEAIETYNNLIANIDKNNPDIKAELTNILSKPYSDKNNIISVSKFLIKISYLNESLKLLEKYQNNFEENSEFFILKGKIELENGNTKKAIDEFVEYLNKKNIKYNDSSEIVKNILNNKNPNINELSFNQISKWITISEELKKYDLIEQILYTYLEKNKNNIHLTTKLIDIYILNKKYMKAFDKLELIIKIAPHLLNYVITKLKIIKENEFSQKVSILLSKLFSEKQEINTEIGILKNFLKYDSQSIDTNLKLAELYFKENMLEDAKKICIKIIDKNENIYSLLLLLKIYSYQDKYIEIVNSTITFSKKYNIPIENILNNIYEIFNIDLLPKTLKKAIAKISIEAGLFERSEQLYSEFIENNSTDPDILYNYAILKFKTQNYSKTISIIQKIPENYKENIEEINFMNAISFIEEGYEKTGKEILENINFENIQDEEKRLEIIYHTANILNNKGSYEKAMNLFQSILLNNIDYKDVKDKVNKIENIKNDIKSQKSEIMSLSPEILSRFTDIKIIGEGGMGKVYKAFDSKINSLVALKVLAEKYKNDTKAIKRFILRDGKAVEELDHPNIIKIYDVISSQSPYIIMELIEGKSLRQLLDKNKELSSKLIKHIIKQSTDALNYAHENNIIHRDIKPDNIMITKNAQIKIMDFGLAKKLDVTTMTETGETFGTIFYMSPEQIRGEQIDKLADIYSFGLLIYEILTGKVPFSGDNAEEVIYKIFKIEPTPPSEINSDLNNDIDKIILKCIAKNKDERYKNIKDFASDILKVF